MNKAITGVDLQEFGPAPKPGIILATGYESVHSKAWITPKKKPELRRDRVVKGACKLRTPQGTRRFDSTEEMLKAMWQDTDKQLEPYRYPDQEAFKNAAKQTGKGIWSNELISSIRRINPALFVEDSIALPGCAAFYKTVLGEKKYTGACFRKGFIPEFTIIKTDAADLPVEFHYGWRTVLLRLVKSRDLTMNQINKVWGHVHHGDSRGKHWAAYTQEFVL